MSRRLVLFASAGLAVRLLLAPATSWSPDLVPWLVRAQELAHGVPLYTNASFSYPPLYAYLLALVTAPLLGPSSLAQLAQSPPALAGLAAGTKIAAGVIPNPAFTLAVKLPAIVADVTLGVLLASLVFERTRDRGRADAAGALWLLNPLPIWVSAIHGQFDALPVLLTVIAVGLAWRRRWAGVGFALAMGALFKLYPVYLLPLAAAAIVFDSHAATGRWLSWPTVRSAGLGSMSLAAGSIGPLLVFLPGVWSPAAINAVFSRAETTTIGSGANLWFAAIIPQVRAAFEPVAGGYAAVLRVLLLVGLAVLVVDAGLRWRSDGRERALLEAVAAGLAVVLLTSSTTNPHYMLWVLPFLVLGWGIGRPYLLPGAVLSVAAPLFYLAMWRGNALALLLPAITYWSFPTDTAHAAASLSASYAAPRWLGVSVISWLMTLVAAIMVAALVLVIWRRGLAIPGRLRAYLPERSRVARLNLAATLVLIAMTCLAGLAVGQRSNASVQTPVVLGATGAVGGDRLEAEIRAGTLPTQLRAVVGANVAARPVYVFADDRYPSAESSPKSNKGLYDHLAISLAAGGWGAPVKRVDAAQLAAVIGARQPGIVIIGSGVVPDTVVGVTRDLTAVRAYLEAGGEIVVMGAPFYWTGRPGVGALSLTDRSLRIDWDGEVQVVGRPLVHNPAGDPEASVRGAKASTAAAALDAGFKEARRGPVLSQLLALNGWDLGWDGPTGAGQRTSIGAVPVGDGRLIVFGGGLRDAEKLVADDIARVLLSGADAAPPIGSLEFPAWTASKFRVSVPLASPFPAEGVRLLVFDATGFVYFHRTVETSGTAPAARRTGPVLSPPRPLPAPSPGTASPGRVAPTPNGAP